MSLAISAVASKTPVYESNEAKVAPTPTPTLSQQARSLASSGNSVTQIATALGISTSQVDSTLGIKTASTDTSSAAIASSAKGLSVRA